MKDDKNRKIFDAVGGIGDDLIEEASRYDAKRERMKKFKLYGALAASFVLVAALVLTFALRGGKAPAQRTQSTPLFTGGETAQVSNAGGALPEALRGVMVSASAADGKIIPTSERFIIETSDECEVETLTANMNVSPETSLAVTALTSTKFEVAPATGALLPGTVYNISFGDRENPVSSYTFQTESDFFIKSRLPSDMSSDVPVGTGIELTFSESIANCDFDDYIVIEPEVGLDYKVYPNGRVLAVIPQNDLEYGTVYKVTVKEGLPSLSGKTLASDESFAFRTEYDDAESDDNYIFMSVYKSVYDRFGYEYNVTRSYDLDEYIFTPKESASLVCTVYAYDDIDSCSVGASLYKFPDTDSAARAIENCAADASGKRGYDTDGLIKIGDFEGMQKDGSYYDYQCGISFGEGLERGIYLAKITAEAKDKYGDALTTTKYIIVQISNVRAFTISSDGKTLSEIPFSETKHYVSKVLSAKEKYETLYQY